MKRTLLFTALYCVTLSTFAQVATTPSGHLYASLPTYSKQFKDAFSFRSNAASLAGVEQFSAGLYAERRFMLQELSSYSFAAAIPVKSGNFGFRGDRYGGQDYNETVLGLAYGRSLGERVDVGLQFNYLSMNASGYGAASTILFDAGVVLQLTETFQTGVAVHNPVGMKIGKTEEERLPSMYSFGLGYDLSPQFFMGAEVQKVEDQPVTVNAGFHYAFTEKLLARGGISSATSSYYLGFGVLLKNLRVDLTATIHPYLGSTPGLLLIYSPSK